MPQIRETMTFPACRKKTLKLSKLSKMKIQRNMQQMKEHSGNPKGQRNKEEIDNLPEKYFNKMIGKMIQNLGNKMEAWIEKLQEMFDEDLEELKNR